MVRQLHHHHAPYPVLFELSTRIPTNDHPVAAMSAVVESAAKRRKIAEASITMPIWIKETDAHTVPAEVMESLSKDIQKILLNTYKELQKATNVLNKHQRCHTPVSISNWVQYGHNNRMNLSVSGTLATYQNHTNSLGFRYYHPKTLVIHFDFKDYRPTDPTYWTRLRCTIACRRECQLELVSIDCGGEMFKYGYACAT